MLMLDMSSLWVQKCSLSQFFYYIKIKYKIINFLLCYRNLWIVNGRCPLMNQLIKLYKVVLLIAVENYMKYRLYNYIAYNN